jgi:hypothetical protein
MNEFSSSHGIHRLFCFRLFRKHKYICASPHLLSSIPLASRSITISSPSHSPIFLSLLLTSGYGRILMWEGGHLALGWDPTRLTLCRRCFHFLIVLPETKEK